MIRGLKRRVELECKGMGQLASELLARALADEAVMTPPFEWKSHDMGVALIDLEDKDALYRIFDEEG